MRLPGEKTWSPGTCTAEAGPRNYRVQVGNAIYRRNRRQLIKIGESSEPTLPDDMFTPDDLPTTSDEAVATSPNRECPTLNGTTEPWRAQPELRKSQRQIKPPAWLKDFVAP